MQRSSTATAPTSTAGAHRRPRGLAALAAAAAVLGAAAPAEAATTRVSLPDTGVQGNGYSDQPALSGDGSVVAFLSGATNLVPGDTNEIGDVFVRDRRSGRTERVNVSSAGAQTIADFRTDAFSAEPAISADGSRVAFISRAPHLVEGDTNDELDVFVHDRTTRTTRRVSVATGGGQGDDFSQGPSISADGTRVAFFSKASTLVPGDTNGTLDVFVHDLRTGETRMVSRSSSGSAADAFSFRPAISGDGRRVAFISAASDLVEGDTNHRRDVFVHDLETGSTRRVSVVGDAQPGLLDQEDSTYPPGIDHDGDRVAFASSADGHVPGDTNGVTDVFLRDLEAGTTRRVSVSSTGAQADLGAAHASLSGDGEVVAFHSGATTLVQGDTNGAQDVFVRDLVRGTTVRASVSSAGQQATSHLQASGQPDLSADGRVVGFFSLSQFFAPADSNNTADVFVADVDRAAVVADADGDGVADAEDGCPSVPDPTQADRDGDGRGDACDPDRDGDGIDDDADNAPDDANPGQEDLDEDGLGDVADPVVLPARAEDCKDGGWQRFHDHDTRFKNQGQCVSSVQRER